MKHLIDIRPVYHRLPERIESHVLLCWLAMLLIRVAENETTATWRQMKKVFSSIQVGIHSTPSGEIWQTSPVKKGAKKLYENGAAVLNALLPSFVQSARARNRLPTTP